MKVLVSDELWSLVEPLIPKRRVKRSNGGRPRVPDRAVLTGILFILQTGTPWEWLPQEMGCGSGVTCWRRLHEWQRRGVWKRVHRVLLDRLAAADHIDWSRAVLDSRSLPAKRGAVKPGRIQRIKANRARSSMLFRMPRAFRSPARRARRMSTMRSGSRR
jgi:transposase